MTGRILAVATIVAAFVLIVWLLVCNSPSTSSGTMISRGDDSSASAPAVVSEPATMILVAIGLAGLAGFASRKKKGGCISPRLDQER